MGRSPKQPRPVKIAPRPSASKTPKPKSPVKVLSPASENGELKKRAQRIVKALAKAYPDARCALHFKNAYELLIATILSAQCTDARVNMVTPALFNQFPDAASMAEAEPAQLETLVQSTGFFRQKAKSILACSQDIVERFAGQVPKIMDELTQLPGVGRKTANVILGNCFDVPAIMVDTHCKRLSNRLELTQQSDPDKIEYELMALIPEKDRTLFSHRIILHGRQVCHARKPNCEECVLRPDCPFPTLG